MILARFWPVADARSFLSSLPSSCMSMDCSSSLTASAPILATNSASGLASRFSKSSSVIVWRFSRLVLPGSRTMYELK
ncbi:hypothetical protein D3C86_1896690 [compost metagenome]